MLMLWRRFPLLLSGAPIDRLDQIMGCISGQFVQIRILMNLLDIVLVKKSLIYFTMTGFFDSSFLRIMPSTDTECFW